MIQKAFSLRWLPCSSPDRHEQLVMMPVTNCLLYILLAAVSLFSVAASANAGSYIGIDGSSVSIDHSAEADINPLGLRLRLGLRMGKGFDLEAHLGSGTDNNTVAFDEIRASFMGLYVKGYLPVGHRSALFGMVGGSTVELTQTIGPGKFSDDRGGISFGFGLETQLTERLDLSADYMRYTLDDGEFSAVSAVNLGLKLYF